MISIEKQSALKAIGIILSILQNPSEPNPCRNLLLDEDQKFANRKLFNQSNKTYCPIGHILKELGFNHEDFLKCIYFPDSSPYVADLDELHYKRRLSSSEQKETHSKFKTALENAGIEFASCLTISSLSDQRDWPALEHFLSGLKTRIAN